MTQEGFAMRKRGLFIILASGMMVGVASGGDLGTVCNRVDGMTLTLTTSNGYLYKATDALFQIVASKEEKDAIDRKVAALKSTDDPKEKEARLVAVQHDQAEVINATADKTAEKRQLTDSQMKQLPIVLFNLVWVGLQDAKLVDDARTLLPEAKDALKSSSSKPSGGVMGALSGLKKGTDDAKRGQQAVNEDLPRIAEEAPRQVKLAGDLAASTRRLMAANKVPEGGAPTISSKPADLTL